MRKILFLILIITFVSIFSNLYCDIYPVPSNLTVSKGDTIYTDKITISWEAPTPPEFGEGFETGIFPPLGWDTLTTNADFTWQIIDNVDFTHSGSYAACVPFTNTEGELSGFDSSRIKNGDFDEGWNYGSLFISEMCDPDTNESINRFIEIFNSADSSIDLTDWKVQAVGDTSGDILHTWNLSGTISSGETKTCGDDECEIELDFEDLDWSDDNSGSLPWDGTDDCGAKLINPKETVVDSAVVNSTMFKDGYMYRYRGVYEGSLNLNVSEWATGSAPTIEDATPGSHTCDLRIPNNWVRSHPNFALDTLSMNQEEIAISFENNEEYLYQNFSVLKYKKYKLTFQSKQDSLVPNSQYGFEIYDNTNGKSLLTIDTLSNYDWRESKFDVYSSSCSSMGIKLFPSNIGDSIRTFWDNIKFEEYVYDANQNEWLISPKYVIEPGDLLTFFLGTSREYGKNSPIYVLLSTDAGNSWNDTLIVCDGSEHFEVSGDDVWTYEEYNSEPISSVGGDTIQIAFQYLGGNGEFVCLDDVSIGGEERDLSKFIRIPTKNSKVKFSSRTPLGRGNRGATLTGYELHRRMFHKDDFSQIPNNSTMITDTTFSDTDVGIDTVYVYKIRAIYDEIIKSNFNPERDTGFVYDDSKPGVPYNLDYEGNWDVGEILLTWHKPDSLKDDIEYYCIYDDSILYDSVPDYKTYLNIKAEPGQHYHRLETKLYKFKVKAKDFAGNYSDVDTLCEVLTPPYLDTETYLDTKTLSDGDVEITVSKWVDGENCELSDSIRIYRSTYEDSLYTLLKLFSVAQDSIAYFVYDDDAYGISYTDTTVRTDSTYFYYATFIYDDNGSFRESLKSRIVETTPVIYLANIDSLKYTETDTLVKFEWGEPPEDDHYCGVYVYEGWSYTTPIDTVYKNTTTYEYTKQGIYDFTFWPFDLYGVRWKYYYESGVNKDVDRTYLEKQGNVLNNVIIGSYEFADFEVDSLTWNQEGDGEWQVTDNGSSQWFTIQDDPDSIYTWGKYALINDDLMGQDYTTNRYLIIPSVGGLNDSDRVYLKFSSFLGCTPSGHSVPTLYESAYISISSDNEWNDAVRIIPLSDADENYIEKWVTEVIELTPYIDIDDILYVAFHYYDEGYWAQGWAIDNVALLAVSPGKLRSILGETVSPDTKFLLSPNFPNPFSNSTTFSFYLFESAQVEIDIYNIRGQKVSTVLKKKCVEGPHSGTWYGIDDYGNKVATGVYLYKVSIEDKIKINKLLLIR